MERIEVTTEKEKEMFISLPKRLYSRDFLTQDEELEMQILNGTHILSKYFSVVAYLVLDGEKVISRCLITTYLKNNKKYLGFFESENNQAAVHCLFEGLPKGIKGPMDCSMWIKYRFKNNNFDDYYTGEPYNKDYYVNLWQNEGFEICDKYYSNKIRRPLKEDTQEKAVRRLEGVLSKGYEFRGLDKKDFLGQLEGVYDLLIDVFNRFPEYEKITKEEFISMYKSMEKILNDRSVILAYKEEELVGFLIMIPNYGVWGNKVNLLNLPYVMYKKYHPSEYVIMYMGASPKHLGLGGAFAELCKEMFLREKCSSIGALIHEGNTSGAYYRKLITEKNEYVMLELK